MTDTNTVHRGFAVDHNSIILWNAILGPMTSSPKPPWWSLDGCGRCNWISNVLWTDNSWPVCRLDSSIRLWRVSVCGLGKMCPYLLFFHTDWNFILEKRVCGLGKLVHICCPSTLTEISFQKSEALGEALKDACRLIACHVLNYCRLVVETDLSTWRIVVECLIISCIGISDVAGVVIVEELYDSSVLQ